MANYFAFGSELATYLGSYTALPTKIALLGSDVRKFTSNNRQCLLVGYDGDTASNGGRIPTSFTQRWTVTIAIVGETDSAAILDQAGTIYSQVLQGLRLFSKPAVVKIDQSLKPYYSDGVGFFPIVVEYLFIFNQCV